MVYTHQSGSRPRVCLCVRVIVDLAMHGALEHWNTELCVYVTFGLNSKLSFDS